MDTKDMTQGNRRFRRGSFSLRLSLYILLVVAAIFVVTLVVTYRAAHKHMRSEMVSNAQISLDNTILQIGTILQEVETAVESTSAMVIEAGRDTEAMYAISEQLLVSNPNIVGSAVAFAPHYFAEKGLYYAPYSYRSGDAILSKQLGTEEYHYFDMEWFDVPMKSSAPHWSEPYYDLGGGEALLATYSYPIHDASGRVYAIFTADISIKQFADKVKAIKPYPETYNFMISRSGAFLAHSRREALISETIFENAVRFQEPELAELAGKMVAAGRGVVVYRRDDVDYYVLYAPVDTTGWSIAVAYPYVDLFRGIYDMRNAVIAIFAVGILLIAVLCYTTIRRLTRPLKRLTQSATDIAAGHFDHPIAEVKGRDEMRQLRDSFEHMRLSIIRYIDELRTATEQRERMASELRVARDIQLGMLPKCDTLEEYATKLSVASRLMAAKEVGGDLYNFFVNERKLYFIVGDVSGKGVPAALIMAVICRMFRTVSSLAASPTEILSMLNATLAENNDNAMFCTAFVGIVDLESGLLSYANAGHNPPIIFGKGRAPHLLNVDTNIPLGIVAEFAFVGGEHRLERGEHCLVYTDGVTEATNIAGELFGDERLLGFIEHCRGLSPGEVVDALMAELRSYSHDCEQSDDIALLDIELIQRSDE